MATRVVKLPDIGEGVAEAEVTAWYVKVGDAVREDQHLADVMTDKATVEIPSPANGTVVALGAEAGTMLAVGAELVRLDTGGTEAAASDTPEPGIDAPAGVEAAENAEAGQGASALEPSGDGLAPPQPPVRRSRGERSSDPGMTAPVAAPRPVPVRAAPPPVGPPRPAGEKPLASPAVRRRALEGGIDLRQVRGSGPAGRISHEDLNAFARGTDAPAGHVPSRTPNTAVEDIKVIGMRRRIAQRMAESKRRAAHFSYVDEVDVSALEELRAALNARYRETRPKLTLIPFLVAALVRSLPDFPGLNALYDDDAEIIHRHGGVHVGIATQTPGGLLVPVVRHAEARDLWDVATEVRRLAEAARAGLAAREELSGSTITITSLGALGGIVTTPVLNRPEVAILGVNKQVMRPVWKEGAFVPRLTMNLSASFDHRVVDGYEAASFVGAIRTLLETPALLFMDP